MNDIIWGINALSHDAAISVINSNGDILFAAHSERYSKIKNDDKLHPDLIKEALDFGKPDQIAFFENRWLKKTRQLFDWQFKYVFDNSVFPKNYLKKYDIHNIVSFKHHESHAASYFTSGFPEAVIVVIDGIGEWNTITIWKAIGNQIDLIKEINYPHSLGILYSAFTKRCGLKPNEEEYILMGMAAYGKPIYFNSIKEDFIGKGLFSLKKRCEYGIGNYLPNAKIEDLASSIQSVLEDCVLNIMSEAQKVSKNLVYSGGVALNCVANSKIANMFENIWIMPNPGDAGSSLGCASLLLKKQIKWNGPYLGHCIKGEYPIEKICNQLIKNKIVGVASGKAEFGPRALGNRSLFADPRIPHIKNAVNDIKKREKFRPFAPIISQEDAEEFFDMPIAKTSYMQFVSHCKHPDFFPAICHIDNTSRVQTISESEHPELHSLIKEYKRKTGCPMLLNTSLNIKGQPLVNDENDAKLFEQKYRVSVLS